jgi:2-oxoglutarate dehydrogenase E2 component (dihydrolipoamide succinyltransferase)
MSENYKVNLPKLGESIHSASIVQWFKKIGDHVKLDEPLLEVSTDKVNSEIPSPVSGVLQEILAHVDQELAVGAPLAVIATGAHVPVAEKMGSQAANAPKNTAPASTEMKDFFSPALLRLAREKGVSMEELDRISGTGEGGRLTKKDLEVHIEKKCAPSKPCPLATAKTAHVGSADVERVKMSGMRKAIADNMVRSFYQAPHATLVMEIDITDVMKLVQNEKETFFAKHNAKLTITSFTARAVAKALQEFPLINSSLDEDTIVVKRFVNLGVAVSVDQGLMVPVVKNCQAMNLVQIAKAISDLSNKARNGKLAPDDVTDGTITITNFGMSGVEIGIPIIRYPEVAIIGMGAVHRKVMALENDVIAVRSVMNICLTFDHRVLDGMYGCAFLAALKKHLETDLSL